MNSGDPAPRNAAIAFILFTLFIDILGIGIVIPVLPELVKQLVQQPADLLLSSQETDSVVFARAGRYVGVIGATYALMQFLFAPIMGALSDRFGRRPVLLVSLLGLGIDFLVQGLAPNIWWLFAGRTLAGIMGASLTTGNAYIADISTEENRARNFGLVGAMFGLGFTIGPALGGLLGEVHLRLPFFFAAGLALLNCLYGFFVLPESLPPEKRSPFTLVGAGPLRVIRRLRSYPLVASLAVVLVMKSLAQRGLENVWVLYTGFRFDWDAGTNGWALGLVGVMAIMVQGGLVRPIIQRIGERRAVVLGTSVSAIAFAGYGLASSPWIIPAIIVVGSLGGISGPANQSLITGSVDASEQGRVQGALTGLTSLTSVIAPLFFNSFLFSYFVSDAAPVLLPGAPLVVGSMLQVIAVFVAIAVFRRFPADPASQQEHDPQSNPGINTTHPLVTPPGSKGDPLGSCGQARPGAPGSRRH